MKNFAFLSLDIIIIIVTIAILTFLFLKGKKGILISLIFATYPTVLIFKNFPYIEFTNQTIELVFLLLIYIFIFWILNKSVSIGNYYSTSFRKIVDSILLSTSYIILIISLQINSLPILKNIYNFSTNTTKIIADIPYGLALIIPIIFILLINKRQN
ncbi:MAG TPA: hypothetical protein PJ997_00165 [Candidatus Paceibacterota bacterium]|nr:hypothetical protein [Candidatus Paceibacterota bacterium]HMP18745.1 hypothetical protein [Candidatus Paceibacterota bacterium]HMP85248.1 hypothetical protein [Candidatus Paceibacterota bacterium]